MEDAVIAESLLVTVISLAIAGCLGWAFGTLIVIEKLLKAIADKLGVEREP